MTEAIETPYDSKSFAEIIHDYVVIRGDIVEPYAREQLVGIINRRLAVAWYEGYDAGTTLAEDGPEISPEANPYR